MDATTHRFANRCLPLTIANSMGWELLCPMTFEAEWTGEDGLDSLLLHADSPEIETYAASHFGYGVLTFLTHHLFRTEPGIGLNVRGSPNLPKDGIHPLEGIVETDWLDFPFTMNWKFTRPGKVRFEAGEPFCFLAPVPYRALETVRPEIVPIEAAPELGNAMMQYSQLRQAFNERLNVGEPDAIRQGWQKWYFKGVHPDGRPGNPQHLIKFRSAEPILRPSPDDEIPEAARLGSDDGSPGEC